MRLHHELGESCPLCEAKLKGAHPFMRDWFHAVKRRYANVHISWAYRSDEDQAEMVASGKSQAAPGKSPHNHRENGQPCSLALDLFLLDEDGVARFPVPFYEKLYGECRLNTEPIRWGGKFSFRDYNHYEMSGSA